MQHGLDLVDEAHAAGWDVLVDVSAFAPTNRLDVARVRPDFAALSFYKIMGFPTGIGCLLLRRDRFDLLSRPWFAGGTITIASVGGDGHYLRRDEGAFEDGTVDYLNLPAVTIGLRYLNRVGLDAIHRRVGCLTGWLLDALDGLRHTNGRRLVEIYGPRSTASRGGTVAFSIFDRDGLRLDDLRVEQLANGVNISLRTGCFCNPGAGEAAYQLGAEEMRKWFGRGEPVSYLEFRDRIRCDHGQLPSAIRISVGVATIFADVYRFLCFLQGFVNRSVAEIDGDDFASPLRPVAHQCQAPRPRARDDDPFEPPGGSTATTGTADNVLEDEASEAMQARENVVNEDVVRAAAGITMALGGVAFVYAYFDKLYWPLQVSGDTLLRRIPGSPDRGDLAKPGRSGGRVAHATPTARLGLGQAQALRLDARPGDVRLHDRHNQLRHPGLAAEIDLPDLSGAHVARVRARTVPGL